MLGWICVQNPEMFWDKNHLEYEKLPHTLETRL